MKMTIYKCENAELSHEYKRQNSFDPDQGLIV